MFELAAALSLAAWLYLVFAHGGFWLGDQRLDGRAPAPPRWPDVVAVVPARDEADLVPRTVRALLDQEYAGRLRVVLVDDESTDGTADAARDTAKGHPNGARLEVVRTAERQSARAARPSGGGSATRTWSTRPTHSRAWSRRASPRSSTSSR
jgi:cellulose synthase/poly-beta-1,6-N-acetylglucosamine synthase-like glycosyltransferase